MYHFNEDTLKQLINDNMVSVETYIKYQCHETINNFFKNGIDDIYKQYKNEETLKEINLCDLNTNDLVSFILSDLSLLEDKYLYNSPDFLVRNTMIDLKFICNSKNSNYLEVMEIQDRLDKIFKKAGVEHLNTNNLNKMEGGEKLLDIMYSINNHMNIHDTGKYFVFGKEFNSYFIEKDFLNDINNTVIKLNDDLLTERLPTLKNRLQDLNESKNELAMLIINSIDDFEYSTKGKVKKIISEYRASVEKDIINNNLTAMDTGKTQLRRKRL